MNHYSRNGLADGTIYRRINVKIMNAQTGEVVCYAEELHSDVVDLNIFQDLDPMKARDLIASAKILKAAAKRSFLCCLSSSILAKVGISYIRGRSV